MKDGDPCIPICGDGLLVRGEECDDGNIFSLDGCNSFCRLESECKCFNNTLNSIGCSCFCGNSVTEYDKLELCDDGNRISGDGCSKDCLIETYYACDNTKVPTVCRYQAPKVNTITKPPILKFKPPNLALEFNKTTEITIPKAISSIIE